MKAFNPEKELNKIQKGNKNKVIFGIFLLLIILGISSSYALYQVRYSKRIIYTKVAPFSNHDIDLAVLVDGKTENDFPEKDAGKIYDKIDCGKTNVKAYWDYDKWALVLETSKKAKCTVYFKTGTSSSGEKLDTSGANPPELYDGLIPIKYDEDGTIKVADPKSTDWYNYDAKQWANAVLIDNTDKTIVTDLSGNGNHGEIVGGAQISDDGLVLDGIDDGIYLGDMIKDIFKNSNTIQIRLKRDDFNDRSTLMSNYPSSNYMHFEVSASNQFYLDWNGGSVVKIGGSYDSYDYVTVTFVYNREEGKISVYNDALLSYTFEANNYKNDSLNFVNAYIGWHPSGAKEVPTKGMIEKVVIYDKVLTESEIQHNLNAKAGKVGNSDGVVSDKLHLYYDFKVPQEVDTTPGKVLNPNVISQMYVWIPRYKYQLFNVNNGGITEQMINIKFEHGTETTGEVTCEIASNGKETCTNAFNGNWYTHPAFKFGDTDLPGIWVGKFESGGTANEIKILPDQLPILQISVSDMFNASRNIEYSDTQTSNRYNLKSSQLDSHMMKNMEWGAMAYLTQSKYGRCDTKGDCTDLTVNDMGYKTGYADANNPWNTETGQLASTTGNMYGIYDTAGDAWEQIMGTMVNANDEFDPSLTGFSTPPKSKYYDVYEYGTSELTHQRGHLGDATRETLKIYGDRNGAWFSRLSRFVDSVYPWVARSGARVSSLSVTGSIFVFSTNLGSKNPDETFRVVLTAQDGND